MSSAFVSKSRKVRFDLTLRIIDLNNVPLVSGTSFIKWHLPSSTAADHRGRTSKCLIKDHRVLYEYDKQLPVRLTVSKDGVLHECSIHFEVLQEYSAGGRGERITLGEIKLNLAEYVEASETPAVNDDGQGVTRRYLMQQSKINSTLKIGIYMKQTEGPRDYIAPPLRTAPVFGGIAGIISSSEPGSTPHGVASLANGDAAVQEGADIVPSLYAANKETGEMQDMYRRTLAAFWAAQPGELKADECIEDVFAGGDGWGKNGRPASVHDNSGPGSGAETPNLDADGQGLKSGGAGRGGFLSMTPKDGYGKHRSKTKQLGRSAGELDEFDVREDLRSWQISEKAFS